jgi:parallel beta-helix repeat protein
MKSRGLGLPILLLVILSSFYTIIVTVPQNAAATTLYVGGIGPGNYTTIPAALIDAMPGDTVFVYSGTYSSSFEVDIPLTLVGENADTSVIEGTGPSHVIRVTSSWVNISGFTITSSGFDPIPAGVEIRTADNCNISNNIILGNIRGITLWFSNNSHFINNTYSDNDYGIFSYLSNGITIEYSNISSNDRGVHLRDSPNSTIRENEISLNTEDGIYVESSNGTIIANNSIASNGENGIWMYLSDGSLITGNAATDNYGGGIVVYVTTGAKITNNGLSSSHGISLWGSDDILISGNTATDCISCIGLEKSINISVSDNVMVGGGIYFSIEQHTLSNWNTHDIDTSNTVNGKPVYYWKNVVGGEIPVNAGQVILANSSGVVVSHQEIENVFAGVEIGYSSNNSIHNNTITDGFLGMFLDHSDNNTIINNTVSSNAYFGILIVHSHGNVIYHNSFIDNVNQSIDAYGTNSWDDGYPSGGNYWSNYTGIDEKSGPNQDQLGGDGLGDTPYVILGAANPDRYPLMSPIDEPPSVTPNDPPTCTISTPTQSEVVSGIYNVTGNASDSDGDVERVEIRIDEGPWFHVWNIPWSLVWDTTAFSNGEHTIYARSYDGENYSEEVHVTVIVDNPGPPTDQEHQGDWIWFAITLIVATAVVVVLIVFMFIRRRREESEVEEPSEPPPEEEL